MINLQEFSLFSLRAKNKLIDEYGKIIDTRKFEQTKYSLINFNGYFLMGVSKNEENLFYNFFPLPKQHSWLTLLPIYLN